MKAIRRRRFVVLMDETTTDDTTTEVTYEVECRLQDQLEAERTARKLHIEQSRENGTAVTALWVWAAMRRAAHFEGTFREFEVACVGFDDADQADDRDNEDGDGLPGEPVDPTPLAGSSDSASPSLWPIPAPTPTTGSPEPTTTS